MSSTTLSKGLLVLKPCGLSSVGENKTRAALSSAGFHILNSSFVKLTRDQALAFHGRESNSQVPESLLSEWTNGPLFVLYLAKRAEFTASMQAFLASGDIGKKENYYISTFTTFKKDVRFFFPDVLDDAEGIDMDTKLFLDAHLYPILTQGLAGLCKEKPTNPTTWLGHWLVDHSPNKPSIQAE